MEKQAVPPKLWDPTEQEIAESNLQAFMEVVNTTYQQNIKTFAALHSWSISAITDFWESCAHFFKVPFHKPWTQVLAKGAHITENRWFVGAKFNYSEALLQKRDDTPALISIKENGATQSLSFNELYSEVKALHYLLKDCGLKEGDIVCAYLPNSSETIVGLLATASIGAIWTSCSPDFGSQAVKDRFMQVKPKLLMTCNAYSYKGRVFSMEEKVQGVLKDIPSIKHVLEVIFIDPAKIDPAKDFAKDSDNIPAHGAANITSSARQGHREKTGENWMIYEQVLADWRKRTSGKALIFASVAFDHPLYILYSSGTTGLPKCIIHSGGGALLKHLSELGFHVDLKEGQRMLFFTTCGWMMWNWKVSALALGVTLVLYDGSPLYPSPERLLQEAARHDVDVLGAGAAYYAQLKNSRVSKHTLMTASMTSPISGDGDSPTEHHSTGMKQRTDDKNPLSFKHLRTLLATGSPLTGELFDYLMGILTDWDHHGGCERLQVASIAGGTDIVGCFVSSCPILPVYRGEIQVATLGVAVKIFNPDHQAVVEEKGELVCTEPFPSMPLAFYGDDTNHSKYKDAYFHTLTDVWFHGDFAEITKREGIIIYGRSDTILNPGGVRIGTAEIYKHLEAIDEILEAAAVTYEASEAIKIVLFVILREHCVLDEALTQHICQTLKNQASPKHVPAKIVAVTDLPKTVNGKIAEKAIKNVIHKQPVTNSSTLANPESLKLFENLAIK